MFLGMGVLWVVLLLLGVGLVCVVGVVVVL